MIFFGFTLVLVNIIIFICVLLTLMALYNYVYESAHSLKGPLIRWLERILTIVIRHFRKSDEDKDEARETIPCTECGMPIGVHTMTEGMRESRTKTCPHCGAGQLL